MTTHQTPPCYHQIRCLPRFRGKLPVILEQGQGVTRDYNTAGVYFLTEGTYTPGEAISFTLLLNHQVNGVPMRVQCRGTVVRTSPEKHLLGVAVTLNSYSFAA